MREELQRLKRELRKEKCPARVLENVAQRVSGEPSRSALARLKTFAAAAGLIVLVTWGSIGWPSWQSMRERSTPPGAAHSDDGQIVEDLRFSLALIGHILLKAGIHTEEIILKEAVPPLRSGFETATKTIISINKI